MKTSLLQWNLRGAGSPVEPDVQESRLRVLRDAVNTYSPSLVLVQEPVGGVDSVLQSLGFDVQHGMGRVVTAFRRGVWTAAAPVPSLQHKNFMLTLLDSVNGSRKVALWNVHLLSRMYAQDQSIANMLHEELFISNVVSWRSKVEYAGRLEIFTGDFNLSPYAPQFWSIGVNRSLHWLRRKRRSSTVKSELFNASWSLLSGTRGPAGTYYFDREHDKPWYVYDQTLLSPELATHEEAELVLEVGGRLLHAGGYFKPDTKVGSDHFPVVVPFALPL